MRDALGHRGPDDAGTFESASASGPLWFGHRRLAILDLSPSGHQPMTTPDGRYTITFNGEIYNFAELREELRSKGAAFLSTSDTEVVLKAWQCWGWTCVRRLKGMFAFALWDGAEERLWLARDRMGEKPLYYASRPGRFLFSSEVRALLASGGVERRMDADGLEAYLTFGSVADPYTLVEGVRAVEAGSVVRVDGDGVHAIPYWTLRDIADMEGPVDEERIVGDTARAVRHALRRVMVSDVPVGVLLSGGIDSSSNAVLLSEMGFRNLMTFSVVFEGVGRDLSEKPWIQLVVDRQKTNHRYVTVSGEHTDSWVRCAVASMDQPTWDGVNTYFVVRAIHETGLKVAVSGQGADELFLGYGQRQSFDRLLRLARTSPPFAGSLARRLAPSSGTRFEKLFQLFGADRPEEAAFLARHSMFSQAGLDRLRGRRTLPQTRFVRSQGGSTPLSVLSRLELAHYLRNTLLRDGDQMSMANSLELRAPFVDSDLVELVAATPTGLRVRPHRQKPLLVDAVGKGLPPEIAERKKHGFELPFNAWLRDGLDLADPTKADLGLDPAEVRSVRHRFLQGQDWPRFWTLVVLASWAARHHLSPPTR